MGDFRWVGVLVGLAVLLVVGVARRRGRLRRGEVLAWSGFGAGVLALSAAPELAQLPADLLGLENRLFAVLVLAVLALFALRLGDGRRLARIEERFGDLVRSLAVREFQRSARSVDEDGELVAVVIPAYNEEQAIRGVMGDIPAEIEGMAVEPIVVVDGGRDGTEEVVRRAGHLVVSHPVNRGQGDALRTGFEVALGMGAAVVVTMDADGQHRGDQLVDLIKPIVAGEADYVQGSRFLGQYDDAGGARDVGIRVMTRLVNSLGGVRITDCTNGFRAIRGSSLGRLHLSEDRFNAAEILMESATRGLRILEIPVHIRTRASGESKKPRRLGYPLGFLRVIVSVWMRG